MITIPFFNKHSCILMALACAVNVVFFVLHNPKVYFAITQAHGHVGYSIYMHNSVQLNPALTECVEHIMREEGQLIEYDRIRDIAFDPPTQSFPINDTIGYGVLLGLLWKRTDSLAFIDVQILQIILFVFLMPVYYQLALLLFNNAMIACMCGIAHLCFFPLIAYNVMPVRDVWAYYGLLVIAYAVCAYLFASPSYVCIALCAFFFSMCLWMRPTLFFALLILTLYAWRMNVRRKKIVMLLSILWTITCLFFWMSYIRFNLLHYDRAVVSPAGQSLLEGLGEIENPWGHTLNDEYVAEYIGAKYGLAYGTIAFDEAALSEFKLCVHENPWHYAKTLFFRLPTILLPGLQWIFYVDSPYAECNNLREKFYFACSSWTQIGMLALRHVYMRLYMLIAWIGLLLLWRKGERKAFWLIISCLCAGLTTFPSHIEYRYVVPFYWVISFAVGYMICCILNYFRHTRHC